MNPSSLRTGFERIVMEVEEISIGIEESLDAYEQQLRAPLPRRLLELGVLLAKVRHGRERARELTVLVPSPNQVPEEMRDPVVAVARALYTFIDSCDAREAVINDLASKLCRRNAA